MTLVRPRTALGVYINTLADATSLRTIAGFVGCQDRTLSHYIRGVTRNLHPETLRLLSNFSGKSEGHLLWLHRQDAGGKAFRSGRARAAEARALKLSAKRRVEIAKLASERARKSGRRGRFKWARPGKGQLRLPMGA